MTALIENICTTFKQIFPNTPAVTELSNDGSFATPLLFVTQQPSQFPRKLGNELMRTSNFDVAYFVDVDSNNLATLNAAGEKIMAELNVIVDENLKPYAQVISPDWSITDKVGHCTFSVIQRMQDDTSEESFSEGNLDINGGIKK